MLNLFSHLMHQVKKETLPLEVETKVHYQINRNKRGWVIMLFNPDGIPPTHATYNQDDPPGINFNARHKVVIRLKDSAGKLRSAGEWWTGKEVPFRKVEKKESSVRKQLWLLPEAIQNLLSLLRKNSTNPFCHPAGRKKLSPGCGRIMKNCGGKTFCGSFFLPEKTTKAI